MRTLKTAAREQATNSANSGETRQNPKTAGFPNLEVTAESSGGEIKTYKRPRTLILTKRRGQRWHAQSQKNCRGQQRLHRRHEKRSRSTDTEPSRKRQKKRRLGKAPHHEHNQQKKPHIRNTRIFTNEKKRPQTDYAHTDGHIRPWPKPQPESCK